ncbi:hypothetical protein [Chryseobacterium sp.]|jgi:hypothetical protein|uniref:hypothetical protein n=1 Tax=Chryseobacterium sp. TaxID=1871047 RepID=UPI002846586D|nr:hypothetical protein [Chryseobacterium sp.]MDR3023081.1 hypothetical protein [Chryseobacterium sp.]
MKIIILSIALLSSTLAFSQVGINTTNPQAAFHVDGAKDNPLTGAPSLAQQGNDFVVTSTGNVGIGTTTPANKLTVTGGKFQYVDGSQNSDYVLTSDGAGVATWKPVVLAHNYATLSATGVNVPSNAANLYTGTFIDLPVGKWQVSVTMLMSKGSGPITYTGGNESWWIRTSFSDSSTTLALSPDIISTSKLVSGLLPPVAPYSLMNGTITINNTSGATKRYYYYVDNMSVNNATGSVYYFGSSIWGENSIVYDRIK